MAAAIKKTAAVALAAGLTLSGSAGIIAAPFAGAQTTNPVNTDPTITGETGTLTIHKRLNAAQTGTATGNEADGVSGTPVENVDFRITRLDYDLTDQEQFNEAAALTAAQAAEQARGRANVEGAVSNGTTDDNGNLAFSDLPIGVYYVEELASENPTANGERVEGLVPAPGFVVFLPMTNPEESNGAAAQTRWNYDVHVYPKNTQSRTEKTVVDAGDNVGDTVEYAITANIPGKTSNDTLDSFNIVDAYNSAELSNMAIASVQIVNAQGGVIETLEGGYALGEQVDYSAPTNGALNNEGSTNVNVQRTISFSDLARLEANRGQRVRVNLTATLNEIGEGDGDVANRARSYGQINYADGTTSPFDTPEDDVVTYLGKVLVNKTGQNGAALSGATFQLYRCNADADLAGDALTVNGANSWTTNDNGLITIDGLHVTDIQNSTEEINNSYCLVETAAPAGYELLTQPVVFNLARADRTSNEVRGTKVTLSQQVDVQNVPTTTNRLPSTGGMGVLITALAGLAIIGGGVYAARRNSQSA